MSFANNDQISMQCFLRSLSRYIVLLFLFCMGFGLSACNEDLETAGSPEKPQIKTETQADEDESTSNDVAAEIQTNKQKWLAHGVTEYQIEMQKLCFCAPDAVRLMIFDIVNNEIETVRYADSGDVVDPSLYSQYSTVEGLFALVEQALKKNPADLTIAYDEKYGYINELTIDYQQNIADDEVTIIASNMKPY